MAQADPQSHHVGTGSKYPIGTKEDPVIAYEYSAFLNSNDQAVDGTSLLFSWSYACFYEESFMNCSHANFLSEHENIAENDCITRLNKHHFRYSVIDGRGDYIIDGLQTDRADYPDIHVSVLFETWRKNPMTQEICIYLNDKIDGYHQDAEEIKKKYLQTSKDLSPEEVKSIQEKFDSLDKIALKAHAPESSFLESQHLCDERTRSLIIFSREEASTAFGLQEKTIHAITVPGMEYYRPSTFLLIPTSS